ncbi:hypothetical protein JCM10213_004427 [Rhodosporidiobolus nylandii]
MSPSSSLFGFPFSLHRRSSSSSSASSSSSSSYPSTPALTASTSSTFDLLEPVSPAGELPHQFVLERSLAAPTRSLSAKATGKRPECNRSSLDSPFSFPMGHTKHEKCPRHGIVHDPKLAMPEREERRSRSCESRRSCASSGSKRSFKCALKRLYSSERGF